MMCPVCFRMMKEGGTATDGARPGGPVGRSGAAPRAVQSVQRAARLLDILAEADGDLSLKGLSERAGLNASTCHHLLATLAGCGLVGQSARTRGYFLGPRVTQLSDSRLRRFNLKDVAAPALRRLSEATKESAHLMALQGDRLALLAGIESRLPVRIGIAEADYQDAAHATASGKAMLAWLPEPEIARVLASGGLARFTRHTICSLYGLLENLRLARRNGFAMDSEEFQEGVVCVATAIRDRAGAVAGAVSVSLPKLRAGGAHLDLVCGQVRAAAADISAGLGCPEHQPALPAGEATAAPKRAAAR